jgi:hypothetical protein
VIGRCDFHQVSDGLYGAPRILADLRGAGTRVPRKTVAASLRRRGLAGISPRQFTPLTRLVAVAVQRAISASPGNSATDTVPLIKGVVPPAVRFRPGTALCVEVIPPVRGPRSAPQLIS